MSGACALPPIDTLIQKNVSRITIKSCLTGSAKRYSCIVSNYIAGWSLVRTDKTQNNTMHVPVPTVSDRTSVIVHGSPCTMYNMYCTYTAREQRATHKVACRPQLTMDTRNDNIVIIISSIPKLDATLA